MHTKPIFALFFLAVTLVLQACATNPVTGKQDLVLMSEEQEIELGRKAHQQVMQQYRAYEDPALQEYIGKIVEDLSVHSHRKNLVFHVTVLDSPQVNAFALPGGYVYITRGIMAYLNSEAEVAGVLGHEIGHVTARHGVRQQSTGTLAGIFGAVVAIGTGSRAAAEAANTAGMALVRGYGREHELEADRLGAEYLARVGYDPQEMIKVVGVLKSQEEFDKQLAKEEGREPRAYHGLFSTHPQNDNRLQEVIGAADKFKSDQTRPSNKDEYLKYTDKMVLGPGEKDGVLRNNKFYHKDLNFTMTFPAEWRIDNLPDRLIAQSPKKDGAVQIMVSDLNKRQSPEEYLKEQFKGKLSRGEAIQTANFQGYAGFTPMDTPFGKQQPTRVAAVFYDKRVYRFAAAAKTQAELDRYDQEFMAAIKSFRKLKPDEVKLAEPQRIKVVKAKAGDTFASLAKQSSLTHHAEEQLRLLNGMYPKGEPQAGQLIKIVQ